MSTVAYTWQSLGLVCAAVMNVGSSAVPHGKVLTMFAGLIKSCAHCLPGFVGQSLAVPFANQSLWMRQVDWTNKLVRCWSWGRRYWTVLACNLLLIFPAGWRGINIGAGGYWRVNAWRSGIFLDSRNTVSEMFAMAIFSPDPVTSGILLQYQRKGRQTPLQLDVAWLDL